MMEFSINSPRINPNNVFAFSMGHLLHEPAFLVECECIIGFLTPHGLFNDFRVVLPAANMRSTSLRTISLCIGEIILAF